MTQVSQQFDADLLVTHREFLRAVARRLVDESRADDVVQETCVRVLERLPMSLRSPRRWLAQVARNVARKTLGREGQRAERERKAAGQSDDGGERDIELVAEVASALRGLPQPYKNTVYLRYYQDLSPREIASRQDVSVDTVKSRLRRGLGLLRADLDARFGDRSSWCLLLATQLDLVPAATGGASLVGSAVLPGVLTVKLAAVLFSVFACIAIVVLATQSSDPAPVFTAAGSAPENASASLNEEVAETDPTPPERTEVVAPTSASQVVGVTRTARDQLTLRVMDAEGRPVEGALVGLLPQLTATSDVDGNARFEFPEVDEGQPLGIRADGFLPFRSRVTLDPGQRDLGTFALIRGGSIRGRVEDPTGAGVADVIVTAAQSGEVFIQAIADSILKSQGIERATATTDGFGEFSLDGVAPGSMRLWAGVGGAMEGASEIVQVVAGEVTDRVVIRLAAAPGDREIAGIVRLPDGVSGAGMRVWSRFQGAEGLAVQTSPVAENGLFRVAVQRDVPHDLWVSEDLQNWDDRRHVWTGERMLSGFRGIVARQVAPGTRDLVLAFEEAPSFEVQAIGPDGQVISRFDLGVIEFEGEDPRIEIPWYREVEAGVRVHVPPIGFYVTVSADGFDSSVHGPFYPGSAPDPLLAELTPLPRIRGRVVRDGAGIPGARVEFFRAAGPRQRIVSKGFQLRMNAAAAGDGLTDGGGEFALTLRQSGSFFVRATASGWPPAEVGPVEIDHRVGTREIEIPLSRGGSIEGRVLLPAGMSTEGWIVGVSRGDPYGETVITGADGRYRFDALTPGDWNVVRLSSLDGITTISNGRPAPWTSNCRVEEGGTTRFDLDFRSGGFSVLQARLDVRGASYPGMVATLRKGGLAAATRGETVDRVPVNADGSFSMAVTEAGTYVLVVRGGEMEDGALSVAHVFELNGGVHRWEERIELGTLVGRLDPARLGAGARPVHVTEDGAGNTTLVPIVTREGGDFGPLPVPAGPGSVRLMSQANPDPTQWTVLVPAEVSAGETLRLAPDRR